MGRAELKARPSSPTCLMGPTIGCLETTTDGLSVVSKPYFYVLVLKSLMFEEWLLCIFWHLCDFSAPMLSLESRIMESRNSRRHSPIAESNIAINLMIWLGFYVKAFSSALVFALFLESIVLT